MADLAINFSLSLVEQIISFTNNEMKFPWKIAGDINRVKEHLKRTQAIVQSKGARSPHLTEILVEDLRVLAYRIEDALDGLMLHGPKRSPNNRAMRVVYQVGHNIRHWGPLHDIHGEIPSIQQELDKIYQSLDVPCSVHTGAPRRSHHHLPQPLQDAEILGAEVSRPMLTSQLTNKIAGEKSRSVVVVVGPPGSGKTVVANSVYSGRQISRHFRCLLGACLSPYFDVNDVLSLLLSQCRDGKVCSTGDSVTDLRNSLKGKRYLVFLDDVWSEEHWKAVERALPDDSNGSRVVITTTKMDVASSIATSSTHIHLVDGLNEEDSWQLFCRKAFSEEGRKCPTDLVELSHEILHKCEGSPMAVSALGVLLGRKQKLPAEWTKVKENLRAEMESSPPFSDLNNSIQQSYDDLNANLKSCLLYFSLFAEGCDIEKARLIRSWVAERFVNQTGEKAAEEVAEEYLNELVGRNLVVANTDFDDRVKNCKVRSFLHYFLTAKSRKEDFAVMLDKPTTQRGENVRRLSIVDQSIPVNPLSNQAGVIGMQLKRVSTCIMFNSVSPSHIMELSNQFKNLKVLDFQGACLGYFPECVVDLGLLRYLSLRGSIQISKIPSSIKNLRYLEFLDLKHTSVTYLPKEICLLHNLRHLLVYHYHQGCYITFDTAQGMKMGREIGSLSSLQKLTLLKAENHHKFFYQLGNLTQLQKLGLIGLRRSYGESLCKSLAKMKRLSVLDLRSVSQSEFLDLDHQDFLCNLLQRVYLKGPLEKLPRWIKSLKSLVRLHLRWSRLETSPIDELQGLNNLIELRLADAYIGNKLKFGRGAFQKLKVLQLEELEELSKVKISKGSICKLEKLTLCNCGKLTTLPSGIQRLTELKQLVLYDMPVELVNSLREGSMDRSKIKVYNSDAAKQTWLEQNLS